MINSHLKDLLLLFFLLCLTFAADQNNLTHCILMAASATQSAGIWWHYHRDVVQTYFWCTFTFIARGFRVTVRSLLCVMSPAFMVLVAFVLLLLLPTKGIMILIDRVSNAFRWKKVWRPALARIVRRKDALWKRRQLKKTRRRWARYRYRVCLQYGSLVARLCHPEVMHVMRAILKGTMQCFVFMLWTCAFIIVTTLLRIACAVVIYAATLMMLLYILWLAVVLTYTVVWTIRLRILWVLVSSPKPASGYVAAQVLPADAAGLTATFS